LFHCATVFPGGSAAAALRAVPPDAACGVRMEPDVALATPSASRPAASKVNVVCRIEHLPVGCRRSGSNRGIKAR
jgi:hypothetical protein